MLVQSHSRDAKRELSCGQKGRRLISGSKLRIANREFRFLPRNTSNYGEAINWHGYKASHIGLGQLGRINYYKPNITFRGMLSYCASADGGAKGIFNHLHGPPLRHPGESEFHLRRESQLGLVRPGSGSCSRHPLNSHASLFYP
jgi:hypothetical protein